MLELSYPQHVFLNGLNTKYRAYVGGFGSGKTFVGCVDLLTFAGRYPKTVQGYFGVSYPSIRDIFYPTLTEAAEMMGFRVDIKESNKEVHLYRGRQFYGTIICRSMDKPATIVGFKIARALVDEIDVLPKDKATQAWRKIIARMRLVIDGVQNTIGVTTTPEGFLFAYDHFANDPKPSYSMVQASTYNNQKFLPDDYIDSLLETYPEHLISAYLKGEFVNLTSGTVYVNFDRHKCATNIVEEAGEPLFVGMDFNVGNMSAVVHVKRDGNPIAVGEITQAYDTPDMCKVIGNRYPDHKIIVFPDSSGDSRKSNDASMTDFKVLRDAGFSVHAPSKNPRVRDRINSMNAQFGKGYKVNVDRCPEYVRCLEQQAYDKNGEPDKKQDLDHLPDAGGYFIHHEHPLIKPARSINLRMTF